MLEFEGDQVRLRLWNIRFTVRAGRFVEIVAPDDVEIVDVRIYVLGTVMATVLHQRGYFPVHANVVRLRSSAAAFAGQSGAGKSTLAAWFEGRGLEVLSDDLCAVQIEQGRPQVFEGIPRMKLRPEALRAFGRETRGLEKVASDLDKYHVPLRSAGRLGSLEPIPLDRVYILDKALPGTEPAIIPLTGVRAAHALLANAFNWDLGQQILDSPAAQFEKCLNVAKHAAVFRLQRQWTLDRFDEEARMIEQHLNAPLDELLV